MTDSYRTFQCGNIRGECLVAFHPHIERVIPEWNFWITRPRNRIYMEKPNRVIGMDLPKSLAPAQDPPFLQIVAKEFGWRTLLDRTLGSLTESKGLRSFRIGKVLHQAGISTPWPLAAWEIRRWGIVKTSSYIYEEIPNAVPVRQVLKDHPARDEYLTSLLKDMASLVRRIHSAGIFHRDLTLGNFLTTPQKTHSRPSRVFIIDLSRAVQFSSLPIFFRLVDLARIKLGDHWDFFFDHYCDGNAALKNQRSLLVRLVQIRRIKMTIRKEIKNIFR